MSPGVLALQLLLAEVALSWSAPRECPEARPLTARLEHVTGAAIATVREEPDGWHLVVRANGSVRTLTTSTCAEAAEAATLFIELALSAPAVPPAWSFHAALVGGASVGWLPAPSARLGGVLGVQRGPVLLGVDVSTSPEQRFTTAGPTVDAAIVTRMAVDAQLFGCWLFSVDRFSAGPCLVFALSAFEARGLNVSNPRSSTLAAWSGGAGARATLRVFGWLELLAGAALRAGPRLSLFFEGFQAVVTAGPVSVELFGAAGVAL